MVRYGMGGSLVGRWNVSPNPLPLIPAYPLQQTRAKKRDMSRQRSWKTSWSCEISAARRVAMRRKLAHQSSAPRLDSQISSAKGAWKGARVINGDAAADSYGPNVQGISIKKSQRPEGLQKSCRSKTSAMPYMESFVRCHLHAAGSVTGPAAPSG